MGRSRSDSRGANAPSIQPAVTTEAAPSPADLRQVHSILVQCQFRIRRRLPVLLLSVTSVVLLMLSFEPIGWWPISFVALVPWLVAIASASRWRWMLFCSWLSGFLFFAGGLYWMLKCGYPGPVSGVLLMAAAQLALAAYLGLYFLLFAYVVGGLVRHWRGPQEVPGLSRLMLTLIVPVAWVATEVLRAYVLSGFPWFLLGHSLARKATLIQIADAGGAYAVSFLLASANALLADAFTKPLFLPTRKGPRPNYLVSAATIAVAGLALLTVVYGRFRIHQVDLSASPGPRVAVIQADFPVSLDNAATPEHFAKLSDERFETYLSLARDAAADKPVPDMVAWPETMVAGHLNPEFLAIRWSVPSAADLDRFYPNPGHRRQADAAVAAVLARIEQSRRMDAAVADLVRESRVPMLVGSASAAPAPADWAEREAVGVLDYYILGEPIGRPSDWNRQFRRYNSAILYERQGSGVRGQGSGEEGAGALDKQRYDKRHLVPFGEYLPFREDWPAGFKLLRKLSPMELLVPGHGPRLLTLSARDGKQFRMAVPICYEDVVPQAVRRLVYGPNGAKQADFLMNISNDGWFSGTTELPQHWAQAIFRCVENRLPMARSVNGGCSGFINSLGLPMAQPHRPLGRIEPGEMGHMSAVLPMDPRVTLYSRIGDVPGWCCVALLFAGAVAVHVRRRRRKAQS